MLLLKPLSSLLIIRRHLSFEWDHTTSSYKAIEMGNTGVAFPTLAAHYTLVAFQKDIAKEYGLNVLEKNDDGKRAFYDLHAALRREIVYSISRDSLQLENGIVASRGKRLILQFTMDAANIHRGVQQTSVAFTLINGRKNPNAPHETHQFCIFEAGDKWEAVRTKAEESLIQINEAIASPHLCLQVVRLG